MSTPLAQIFNKSCKKILGIFVVLFFSVYKQWVAKHYQTLFCQPYWDGLPQPAKMFFAFALSQAPISLREEKYQVAPAKKTLALMKKAHKSGLFIVREGVYDYLVPSNLFLSASEIKSKTFVTCFTPGTLRAISTARFASASVTMPIK